MPAWCFPTLTRSVVRTIDPAFSLGEPRRSWG